MALLIQVVLKVSLVLLTAWGLTRLMTRSSAAARHLVWATAVVVALVLPVVQAVGPQWELPVLPASPMEMEEAPADVQPIAPAEPFAAFEQDALAARAPGANFQLPADKYQVSGTYQVSYVQLAGIVWAAIALLMLGRLLAGLLWAGWIARRADDVTDEGWLEALDDAAAALGVTQQIALKVTPRTTIPAACGLWRPAVLLPREAAGWPMERRRVVLLHELAHVARRDCVVQAIVHAARALYWFNPLVHVAAARVRAEQERACDDLVLAAGTEGSVYADHLFEIARAFASRRFPAWATLAMARPSQLEGRVVAILDTRRNRRPPTAPARAAMAAAAATLILSVGGLQLTAASPAPTVQAAVSQSDALIDPNPRPPRPDVEAMTEIIRPFDASAASEVVVNAVTEFIPVLPLESHDVASEPVAELVPTPGPGSRARRLAQAQAGTAVTDETRRRVADALITALNDENQQVREQAINSLAAMRDRRAIPGLVRATRDGSPQVRQQALSALAQFDSQEAIDAIVAAVSDTNPEVRRTALNQMSGLFGRGLMRDQKYVTVFTGMLKDTDNGVRQQAIVGLARLRNTEAVPALLPLLTDPNAQIRVRTASALGALADPRAIDGLTAALKDTEPQVREAAARALGAIARGQRRGNIPPPPPPPPALPAPAVSLPTEEEIREAVERAMLDLERFELNLPELERIQQEAQREAERGIQEALRELERHFSR